MKQPHSSSFVVAPRSLPPQPLPCGRERLISWPLCLPSLLPTPRILLIVCSTCASPVWRLELVSRIRGVGSNRSQCGDWGHNGQEINRSRPLESGGRVIVAHPLVTVGVRDHRSPSMDTVDGRGGFKGPRGSSPLAHLYFEPAMTHGPSPALTLLPQALRIRGGLGLARKG